MTWIYASLLIAGAAPLSRAWRACRGSSLEHAVYWLGGAWLGWAAALLAGEPERAGWEPFRFVALALTTCPVAAVLGARQPYVAAWNFVVLGLLAVMLLPLLEMLVLGTRTLDGLRLFFLGATLGIGILNYLPTRFFLAALWCGTALAVEFASLVFPEAAIGRFLAAAHVGLLLSPWIAWMGMGQSREGMSEVDRLWLGFRDRFGLVWGQRVREQFNSAAVNAGWSVTLSWRGLRGGDKGPPQQEMTRMLRAVLRRFMPEAGRG